MLRCSEYFSMLLCGCLDILDGCKGIAKMFFNGCQGVAKVFSVFFDISSVLGGGWALLKYSKCFST